MKIVIIEDEPWVSEDLANTLRQADPNIEITRILSSVKESIRYFSTHPQPDLLFSDINLGDGLSFEIYDAIAIQVPVIFCTAYDEYALAAFNANGIEYILKPFSMESVKKALAKFRVLQLAMASNATRQYEAAMAAIETYRLTYSESIVVKFRDKLLPFRFEKIALFFLDNEVTYLYAHTGRTYVMTESLEELEKKTGQSFFRVNRQFLINRNAIQDATHYFPRKLKITLLIPFQKEIFVSKEKKGRLLDWL